MQRLLTPLGRATFEEFSLLLPPVARRVREVLIVEYVHEGAERDDAAIRSKRLVAPCMDVTLVHRVAHQ